MPGSETARIRSVPEEDPLWRQRKYLLLLAILVATVTYVAGLDPPGGIWLETKDGHRTGNPILPATRPLQYKLFYYFNATAFAVSLSVSILLLFMKSVGKGWLLGLRGIMVMDACCLLVPYVAGSCRGRLTTIYASVVCAAVFLFVVVFTWKTKSEETSDDDMQHKERRKVLMLLAIFVATITYTAALNPPGGFWEHAQDVRHRAGDPILLERHWGRFVVFLLFNTAAFAASLVIVTLVLSRRLWKDKRRYRWLGFAIMVALIGIVVSYAAGSSRKMKTTAFIFSLVGLVAAYIAAASLIPGWDAADERRSSSETNTSSHKEESKDRSLILLLATLASTVTYQAGLSPPGGVWRDNSNGHIGGDLILPATHARQYQVFFFCNSAAFVTSIIVVMMVQSMDLVSQHALMAAVILDLLGLIAAYVAGSCRDVLSSIYVLIAVAVVVIFVVLVCRRREEGNHDKGTMEKRRKLLLLLAILAVTITYQAGLSPPGKFWLEDGDKVLHHVGDPVLADNYPRRYKVFFYSNTASFMGSIAVIMILVMLPDTSEKYRRRLLNASMAVSLIALAGLLLAYAAGTTRRVKTSIYVLMLVPVVLLVALILVPWLVWHGRSSDEEIRDRRSDRTYRLRRYLMLVGILAASVTYQAGLDPPGGVWPRDDGNGNSAGNPALHEGDRGRYHAFFYSNSTCFVASVVVIVLLLHGTLRNSGSLSTLMKVTHTVVVLDLLGLLVAYAVGSSRDWHTSGYLLAMAVSVLAYVAIYVVLSYAKGNTDGQNQATGNHGINNGIQVAGNGGENGVRPGSVSTAERGRP